MPGQHAFPNRSPLEFGHRHNDVRLKPTRGQEQILLCPCVWCGNFPGSGNPLQVSRAAADNSQWSARAILSPSIFKRRFKAVIMGNIRKDHDGVHLDYSVTQRQNFDQAVFGLLQLVQEAQRDYPDEPRHLQLAVEGHRLPNGAFDSDMFELQSKFLMEFLMEYLTSANTAFVLVKNPKPQKNVVPPLNIFQRDQSSGGSTFD